MKTNPEFSTYFELLIDFSWKKYKTRRILGGRQEIYDYCLANGITIHRPDQITSYHIRESAIVNHYDATEI